MTITTTREGWLLDLVEKYRPRFEELGFTLPALRVGVGFTSTGRRSKRIGECWISSASADGTVEIFLHPSLGNTDEVAHVLAHELIHSVLPEAKHGPEFKKVAHALGLTGKMTATVPGPEFEAYLHTLDPGDYPHARLADGTRVAAPPKQATRQRKCVCLNIHCPSIGEDGIEGYICRTTQKWIIEYGAPICPACDLAMTPQEQEQ